MKLVLAYTLRFNGSAADHVANALSAQKLAAEWAPNDTSTVHEWLTRCDGNGGFAVMSTDDAKMLYRDLATWSPWLDFAVYPVLDEEDAVPLEREAVQAARSVI